MMAGNKQRPTRVKKDIVLSVAESAPVDSATLPQKGGAVCTSEIPLGGKIVEYPESVDHVDTVPGTILTANPRRCSWYLFNLSDNEIYVAFSNRVSSTYGLVVEANGGYLSFNCIIDPFIPPREVWASAAADDSKIYLFEVIA